MKWCLERNFVFQINNFIQDIFNIFFKFEMNLKDLVLSCKNSILNVLWQTKNIGIERVNFWSNLNSFSFAKYLCRNIRIEFQQVKCHTMLIGVLNSIFACFLFFHTQRKYDLRSIALKHTFYCCLLLQFLCADACWKKCKKCKKYSSTVLPNFVLLFRFFCIDMLFPIMMASIG